MLVRLRSPRPSSHLPFTPSPPRNGGGGGGGASCPESPVRVHLYTHRYVRRMRFVIPVNPTILRRAAPTWQGFQMTLHPRYEALYDPF